jgi:Cu/Ag efflux pump CusA
LSWLIPATVVLAALLRYLHFRSWVRVGLVLLCLPFSLVGGVWLVYALDFRLSVAVAVIVGGLLPVMAGEGLGSDVMKRIAAPLVGGMLTAPLLSLIILPVIYQWWQRDRHR